MSNFEQPSHPEPWDSHRACVSLAPRAYRTVRRRAPTACFLHEKQAVFCHRATPATGYQPPSLPTHNSQPHNSQLTTHNSQLTTHNSQLTTLYMKTKLADNFHFRIKYLTVTRPVDKMCNTQPQSEQNQIHNCQTPRPRQKRKTAFSPTNPGEGGSLQPATCNL
jgi:hypothetical protein